MPFKEWMLEAAVKLRADIFEKLLMLVWSLWRNRNVALWENKSKPATALLCTAMAWLEEFHKARAPSNTPKQLVKQSWKPAGDNHVMINVDGAFLPSLQHGGIGGVVRGSGGHFLAAFAHYITHVSSAKHAELMAIREGLDLAVQLQLPQVIVKMDCLAAVQDLTRSGAGEFASLIDDILEVHKLLSDVNINYVPRQCNRIAHRLAGIGFESHLKEAWYS
ncbi:uncharacterized protein LOC112167730 [Rosa chinensis]|uniref:uncharacterized protein LOC112167730 n=1 Tax=Rosa chinensis TaxID=74649 RepID=UPI000D095C81|nr:uncharacterized protein LOC112167730 [Rosa chinensis]